MFIEHVALYVADLEAARRFFIEYFGATSNAGYVNAKTGFRSYFLTFDGGARLEIMTAPELIFHSKPLKKSGYAHIAFSLGSPDAVDALTRRLKNDGFKILSGPRTTGDGYYESCVVDLEGNQIELTI